MLRMRLIGLCGVGALSVAAGYAWSVLAEDPTYVGHTQCKVCHNSKPEGSQWDMWKKMDHAKAFETLSSDAAKAAAQKMGLTTPPAESPECLKCHVTAYDVEKKSAPATIKPKDGVQCESCHGPSSIHIKVGKIVKFNPEKAGEVDIMGNRVMPDADTCKKCHNDQSPTWDPERYTLEDGTKVGFDFDQASKKIAHPNPKKAAEKEKAE